MEMNLSSWTTHNWISRHLELVPGQPLVQQVCHECGRAFVDERSTGERYAVHVSIFKLHRLSDEVTSRWLSEKCPGESLLADEADRQVRFLSASFVSALGEITKEPVFPSAAKSKILLAVACSLDSITKPSTKRLALAARSAAAKIS